MNQWVPLKDAEAVLGKSYRHLLRLVKAGTYQSKLEKINGRDTTLIWLDEMVNRDVVVSLKDTAHGVFQEKWERAAREGWLHDNEPYSEATIYSYKNRLKRYFDKYTRITRENLMDAQESICGGKSERVAMWRAISCYAVYIHEFHPGILPAATLEEIKKAKAKPNKNPRRKAVDEQDFQAIIQHIEGNGYYSDEEKLINKTLVCLLWYTGARNSEVCGIKLCDLNLGGTRTGFPELFIRKGKGDKSRFVPLPSPMVDQLITFLKDRPGPTEPTSPLLWEPERGRPLKAPAVSYRMRRIFERTGIECKPHDFRRGYASFQAMHGTPIDSIKELLGHESIDTTQIYVQTKERVAHQQALAAYK
jgi:integrase